MSDLFKNEERTAEEQRQMEAIRRERAVNVKALIFTLAVVMAPFLALLFSIELGLFVLALALAFTTWLTLKGASEVGPVPRSRLRVIAGLNFVIMLVVLGILALRLT